MKKANIFACAALFILIFAPCAHAYIDPGTGPMIWQLICAAVVGLGFFGHKIKDWLLYSVLKRKKAKEEEE